MPTGGAICQAGVKLQSWHFPQPTLLGYRADLAGQQGVGGDQLVVVPGRIPQLRQQPQVPLVPLHQLCQVTLSPGNVKPGLGLHGYQVLVECFSSPCGNGCSFFVLRDPGNHPWGGDYGV